MQKYLLLGLISLCLSGCGFGGSSDNPSTDATSELVSDVAPVAQLPENVSPTAYRIDLRMNPDDVGYSGVVEIDVDIQAASEQIWLHAKYMTVTDARITYADGASRPLIFEPQALDVIPSGVAALKSETGQIDSGRATLRLPFETPYNLSLNSAYKVERDGEAYVVTQFEPLGAREAFPSFDEPRFKTPFTMSISAPAQDVVIANTPEVARTELADGWIKYDFATTRPLPTYLIAFAVGPYDVVEYTPIPVTELRDRPIPLRGVAAKGSGEMLTYALENTAGLLTVLEDYFGVPYPYEKMDLIAAPEYAFGAMENPGAIVYREYLLLMDESAPLAQRRAYARVHAHELAHQWFGNLVTPYWWEDIWLNEAFATWMGNKGTVMWKPDGDFDRVTLTASLAAMSTDSLSTTRRVREPLLRSEQVMDQFDAITYRKGGGTLDMIEAYLGEEKFQKGVRLHMQRYADDVATADDFFQSLADGSEDQTVVAALKSFVDQPGLPLIDVEASCETKSDNTASVRLELAQSRYKPLGSEVQGGQLWQIPLCMRLGHSAGASTECTLLTSQADVKTLQTETCPAYILPNQNGAGYFRFDLDTQSWENLFDNLEALSVREVLSVQDSHEAAFRAGKVSPEIFMAGLRALANHESYDVAASTDALLGWMHRHLPNAAQDELAIFVRDLYADRFANIRNADSVEAELLGPRLARHLMFLGQDEALTTEMAEQAKAYLGLSSGAENLAPRYLPVALQALMHTEPEVAIEPILNLAKTGSSFEKSAALGALGRTPDPEQAARLRDIALDAEQGLTGRQGSQIVFALLSSNVHRDATWDWLVENFEAFVTNRVPDVRKGRMPGYGSVFCDMDRARELTEFMTANAELIPGYERSLSQMRESIALCAALKSETIDGLAKALQAQ